LEREQRWRQIWKRYVGKKSHLLIRPEPRPEDKTDSRKEGRRGYWKLAFRRGKFEAFLIRREGEKKVNHGSQREITTLEKFDAHDKREGQALQRPRNPKGRSVGLAMIGDSVRGVDGIGGW